MIISSYIFVKKYELSVLAEEKEERHNNFNI